MTPSLSASRTRALGWLAHVLPCPYRPFDTFRFLTVDGHMSATSHIPELFAETDHGINKNISEADLYRYTRHRWLKNEQDELAKRYVEFNLAQLVKEATGVCKGARYCTRVLKCIEGLHNKALILTMDNGAEVFAKLPNPNAGPPRYTTASEVATRQMLRDVFKIPVPRVLAWSCDSANNPVQAEYILEERASGVRLGAVWHHIPWDKKLAIVDQIAEIDGSLSGIRFKTHGCIYFREDLQQLTGDSVAIELSSGQHSSNLEQYAFGPLVKAELWANGREHMNIDRGPWQASQAYARALGTNETSWIKENAQPRMNYYRYPNHLESPEDALDLLAKYDQVAPFLAPSIENSSASANTLWHPDLHLDNVFVDPVSHRITGIVDWQSAAVAPLFYQSGVHRAFRHYKSVQEGWVIPKKPDDFDTLDPSEQKQIDKDLESETIHKYYGLQTMKRAPLHWNVLQQPSVQTLKKPVWLVTGVWENQDLFFLRDSLISIVAQWNLIFGDDIPCPISFSADELELFAKEEENISGVGQMLSLFRDQRVLPTDGMVQPEDYQTAVENCAQYKEVLLNAAQNEEEREMFEGLWPY